MRPRGRNDMHAVPKGWVILGLALASWVLFIVVGQFGLKLVEHLI
jgi:hypothetical protein